MSETEIIEKDEKGRFLPGNSGFGGRPKGSRNKLGEDFIKALHDDFDQHGIAAIQAMRIAKPHQYLNVIAGLLPRELKVTTESDLTNDQLNQRIRQLAAAISLELNGCEAGTGSVADGEEAALRPDQIN